MPATVPFNPNHDHRVYVYAGPQYGLREDDPPPPTAQISIQCNVTMKYKSDRTADVITDYNENHPAVKYSSDSLTSDDGTPSSLSWGIISGMISDMNLPFPLERLHWRDRFTKNLTPLESQDDFIARILEVGKASYGGFRTNVLDMVVYVNKVVILPHHEFEALDRAVRGEQFERNAAMIISSMLQEEASSGTRFQYWMWESRFENFISGGSLGDSRRNLLESLMERALRASDEQATFKLRPATKSSVQALEKVRFGHGHDSEKTCVICMDEVLIGSQVTGMPCSHVFHENCILQWLKRSHKCPLCGFKLPTA